jgi:hypothetical protein
MKDLHKNLQMKHYLKQIIHIDSLLTVHLIKFMSQIKAIKT